MENETKLKDFIALKWGTIKGWDIETPDVLELLKKYISLGSSMSAMAQRDTPEQKQIICQMIDLAACETIYLDWDGKDVSKEEAKNYVMTYGDNT